MEAQIILLTLIILFLKSFGKRKTKTVFNSKSRKFRKGLKWIFQLDNSYLSTTIIHFAVPFHIETEWSDQMSGHLITMLMILRYFRRRSNIVPYWNTDVNNGRCSSYRDSTQVVSLQRVRALDSIAVDLYNALRRDRFQVVPRPWRNYYCMFCQTLYWNITPRRTLEQTRQWVELTIPDGMEGHTIEHIRQFLLPGISNARPQNSGSLEPRMRNVCISTERLTLLFPHNCFIDNRPVTVYSPPFLVRGLRFCLQVYPNGIGDGHMSHMSVFLVMANTQYLTYSDLRFPLAVRVTLVANQRHYTNMAYTVVVRNPRRSIIPPSNINLFGFEMFVQHQQLEHYFVRDGMITFIIELDN